MNEVQKRPSDYMFTVVTRVSALERQQSDRWYAHSRDVMRHRLAAHVSEVKMKETHDKHHSEYRLEVVVMTPSELYALINAEAQRIALRYGHAIDTGSQP